LSLEPNLSLPKHILLQHFFLGLNKKTRKYLNTAVGGSFLYTTAEQAKDILMKVLIDLFHERGKLLDEEPQFDEPESFSELSQPLDTLEHDLSKEEEETLPDFMLEIEDDLFANYENTSK